MDWRWEAAEQRLDALSSGQRLTPSYARQILEAVHLKTLTSYTLYSNMIDLKNQTIYLRYVSALVERAELDMAQEFARGQRLVEMRELLSAAPAQAGGATVASYFLSSMASLNESPATVARLLLYHCYQGGQASSGLDWVPFLDPLAASARLLVLACRRF